jgi:hypothetical protein
MLNDSDYDAEKIAADFAELAGDMAYKTANFVLCHIQSQ